MRSDGSSHCKQTELLSDIQGTGCHSPTAAGHPLTPVTIQEQLLLHTQAFLHSARFLGQLAIEHVCPAELEDPLFAQ